MESRSLSRVASIRELREKPSRNLKTAALKAANENNVARKVTRYETNLVKSISCHWQCGGTDSKNTSRA